MEAMNPTTSENNPTFSEYLPLRMPTAPMYTVNTYSVVSVLPWMVDAILPIIESGP